VDAIASQSVIQWFWATVANFSAEERSKLLQFSTGTPFILCCDRDDDGCRVGVIATGWFCRVEA
jgi:hypothetical protein